ncbi:MAG: protein kinase [Planctomyces sp.]|nr:protein kinase [Planctomyces sp.]
MNDQCTAAEEQEALLRIAPICREFETRLRDGESPAIEEFLDRAPECDRPLLTRRLAEAEIAHLKSHGQSPSADVYVQRFGDVAEFLSVSSEKLLSTVGHATNGEALLEPLTPGLHAGPYQLQELVGQGAFGEVWTAYDSRLLRLVAIKTPRSDVHISAEGLNRFHAEAQRVARLRHSNIAAVYDVGFLERRPYIVYEYIEGESLRNLLQRGRLNEHSALSLFLKICAGVDNAHAAGIVHRDLKPANVLIDKRGEPHIVDFGMAKLPTGEPTGPGSWQLAGTPQYMSPEQAAGESGSVTPATDVYALGVILYELLTGERPFQSSSSDLLRRIREEPPPPMRERLPGADPVLEDICSKAMAKRPTDRYRTAGELGRAIERHLKSVASDGETVIVSPPSARPPGMSRRRLLTWGAGAAAAAAALIPVSEWYRNRPATVNVRVTTSEDPPPNRPQSDALKGPRLVFWRILPTTNEPDPDSRFESDPSPVTVALRPGRYLVVAAMDDGRFHEVYRTVPEDPYMGALAYSHAYWKWDPEIDALRWQRIEIPGGSATESMIEAEGQIAFQQGFPIPDDNDSRNTPPLRLDAPPLRVNLPGFWIDPVEATWSDYRRVVGTAPPSWSPSRATVGDDEPVLVTWDEAMDFAERAGKRLMSEAEYEYVASNRGTTRFPWGDDPATAIPWSFHAAAESGADVTIDPAGVRGLYSNAGEWTVTAMFLPPIKVAGAVLPSPPPGMTWGAYVVRGYPADGDYDSLQLKQKDTEEIAAAMREVPVRAWSDRGVKFRAGFPPTARHGVRFAVSKKPRLERSDLQATSIEIYK